MTSDDKASAKAPDDFTKDLADDERALRVEQDARVQKVKTEAEETGKDDAKKGHGENQDG